MNEFFCIIICSYYTFEIQYTLQQQQQLMHDTAMAKKNDTNFVVSIFRQLEASLRHFYGFYSLSFATNNQDSKRNNKLHMQQQFANMHSMHISAYAIRFPLFLALLNSNCLSKSSFHVNLVFCCCFLLYVFACSFRFVALSSWNSGFRCLHTLNIKFLQEKNIHCLHHITPASENDNEAITFKWLLLLIFFFDEAILSISGIVWCCCCCLCL